MPTIVIRIPRPLKKRTADAKSGPSGKELDALIDDLVDRVWGALEAAKSQMSLTKDEASGHAFHGNQYVKGKSGPKPDKEELKKGLTEKTAKGKLRELFETGHEFSQEELMEVAGIDKVDTFKAFIYYMRTPKFAGKKGALDVVKDKASGLWSVKMNTEGGQQEVAALIEKAKASPKPKAQPKAPEAAIAAPAPPPAPPAPPPAAPSGYGGHIGAMSGVQPGSMSKVEADKHYGAAMEDINAHLESMAVAGAGFNGEQKAAMLKVAVTTWKKRKASAMAAWAQAVHGTHTAPKAQEYFKADEHLGTEVASGTPLDKAIANWKNNTALEKSGQFPPKPKAKAKAATASPPTATMSTPVPVAARDYHELRPEGFKDIGPDDMVAGRYSKGIGNARRKLVELGTDGEKNKIKVEKALRERLKDKPNFQALVARLGLAKEGYGSIESRLISAWAASSGNGNPISVSLQLAARDAFGIPDGHVEKKALSSLKQLSHEDEVYSKGITQLNPNMTALKPEELPACKEALKEFVHAQYDETQATLKKAGLDEVYLARGMKFDAKHDAQGGAANLRLQPASSFSTNIDTARSFASSGGTVFLTKVPRQQVLSTYHTGFGCTSEHEVVVLAHDKMKAYGVPSSQAASALAAEVHVKNKIKGVKA